MDQFLKIGKNMQINYHSNNFTHTHEPMKTTNALELKLFTSENLLSFFHNINNKFT